jgi:hypothetical protein
MKPGTNVTVRLSVRTDGAKTTIKPIPGYVQESLDPEHFKVNLLIRFPKWRLGGNGILEPLNGHDDEPYWCYFSADDPRLQVV